jgi:poly(3-hydroxybutyrate) depolymerase
MPAATPTYPLYQGARQPPRRSFDIAHVVIRGERVPVAVRDVLQTPFYALSEFQAAGARSRGDVLVVAPLSGHFPLLLRDLVVGLLPAYRVFVTDWINVRHVSLEHGTFGLAENIRGVRQMIEQVGPGATVVALCQGGVAALAATAALAAEGSCGLPKTLVLIAAPIDPLANPTQLVRALRARPTRLFQDSTLSVVPGDYAGAGRAVYPAHVQLASLWTYLLRRTGEGGELLRKVTHDDGSDPELCPFLDAYTSIMDLDARFFVENLACIYRDEALLRGSLCLDGVRLDLGAIRDTALLTVEGERDDIAAPGQTSSALDLCRSVPSSARRSLVVPRCAHFSLFHGEIWRRRVLPEIRAFLDRQQ